MTTESPLTGRDILRFYLPLAISWLFMGLEGPISVGVISHRPNAEVNTAAFLAMMSLAIWIESPVIDLLATATTLAKDRQSFRTLQSFAQAMNLWVTAAHALIVLTPLYDVVAFRILALDPSVAGAARQGLVVMIPWSALIGWRRYRQGVLIRNGQTRVIGVGTALRVSVVMLSAIGLGRFTGWPSTVVVAAALLASVASESIFVHFISERVIREKLLTQDPAGEPLTLRKLCAFHFPLTATTMVKLLTTLVLGAGLARTVEGRSSMAAFQIAGTCVFLFRAFGFCLPEVVVALYKDEDSRVALRRFCLGVAVSTTATMVLLSVTTLDGLLFRYVLGAAPELVPLARSMFIAVAFAPLLDAVQSYLRGLLTAHHLTLSRMTAVVVATAVLIASVNVGVQMKWSGPAIAGIALTAALIAELGVLAHSWIRFRGRQLIVSPG